MILENLIAYQKNNSLTDTQMGKFFGYSRVHWQRIKSGAYPLNDKFLMRVQRKLPEIFLSSDVINRNKNVPSAFDSQSGQNTGSLKERIIKSVAGIFRRKISTH